MNSLTDPVFSFRLRLNRYEEAALLVHGGLRGRSIGTFTPASTFALRLFHYRWYRIFYAVVCLVHLGLGFFENETRGQRSDSWVIILDFLILLIYGLDIALQVIYLGKNYLRRRR